MGGQYREGKGLGRILGQGHRAEGKSWVKEGKGMGRVWGCIRDGGVSQERVGRVSGDDKFRGGAGRAGRVPGGGGPGKGLVPAAPA